MAKSAIISPIQRFKKTVTRIMNASLLGGGGQKRKKKKLDIKILEDSENVNSLQFMHLSVLQLEKKIGMIEDRVKRIKDIMSVQDSKIKNEVRNIRQEYETKLVEMGFAVT